VDYPGQFRTLAGVAAAGVVSAVLLAGEAASASSLGTAKTAGTGVGVAPEPVPIAITAKPGRHQS
jgi:hypothetical protein